MAATLLKHTKDVVIRRILDYSFGPQSETLDKLSNSLFLEARSAVFGEKTIEMISELPQHWFPKLDVLWVTLGDEGCHGVNAAEEHAVPEYVIPGGNHARGYHHISDKDLAARILAFSRAREHVAVKRKELRRDLEATLRNVGTARKMFELFPGLA